MVVFFKLAPQYELSFMVGIQSREHAIFCRTLQKHATVSVGRETKVQVLRYNINYIFLFY